MAQSDALLNEVARLVNVEFFEHGNYITGDLLGQLIVAVQKELTDDVASA